MRRPGLGPAAVASLALLLASAVPAYADEVRDAQWHVDYLDLATAHGITRGEGQTVAVLDTGVDATHPDLRDALEPGIDLVDPENPDAWTPEEHGTLVAGVIGGQGHGPGGGDGVIGVAPGATILPIRAATGDDDDQPRSQLVADGIRRAVELGASVISISLSSDYSELDEYAIVAARRSDVVVVAAAGNLPDAEAVTFPAALPTVVAVGGVDEDGGVAEFSVTGPELALTAPGAEIVTARPGGEYAIASGTSLAAPIVAGTTALVRAQFPQLSADEVIHRLVSTAADSGPAGQDEQYGHGIVDVVAALTEEVPPMPPVADEPDEHRLAQWHLEQLDAPAAHDTTQGEEVTVALVGSGVDGSHPDLHRNVQPGVDLAEPENDDAWTPTASGTALAGIIAGHGNRLTDHQPGNRGVLGVAPAATLLPVRVNGPGRSDRAAVELAAEGIETAVAAGAQVICYTAGRASQDLFTGAIEAARAADVVVVAAAAGGESGGEVWFPAANPAVLAATATDPDGDLPDDAVTGPEVTLAAPAHDLLSAAPADGYAETGGAEAAAAVIAGAAALVRAAYPELTADQVIHRLVATADDAGPPGQDERYGHGVLNLVEALTADVPPPSPIPRAGPTAPGGGAAPSPDEPDFGSLRAVVLVVAVAALLVGTATLVTLRSRRRRSAPDETSDDREHET